jgi:hypothetical protein
MFTRGPTHRPAGRALFALVTLVASFVLTTTAPSSAITVSSGVIGGFQVEGNEIVDDDPLITPLLEGTLDWANQTLASAGGTLTVITDDTLDSGFTEGSKELKPGAWACGTGGAKPPKSDILKAFINPRISAAGIFLDLAFIRKTADDTPGGKGDVHLNFEFNQGTAAGTCPIIRVAGDLLVTYDFPGGSDLPIIGVYRWVPILPVTDDADGNWVPATLFDYEVAAAVNAGNISDPVGGLGTLGPQQFGEVSLDLTRILGGQATCVSFGSANVRSRSSGESITSALQDKLPSTPIDFSTCGQIDLVKRSDTGEPINGAKFQLYKSADSVLDVGEKIGGVCTTPGSISAIPPVLGDPAPPTPDTGVCEWTELNTPGTYWVVETAAPAGYTIDPDPVVGPINLAFRGTVTIDGAGGFTNFKWRYLLNLSPEATNLVGTDHVFTATLQVQKTATGAPEAAAGKTLNLSLSGQGAFVPSTATTCVTNDLGQCSITIHSDTVGNSTLSASYDGNVTTIGVDASASEVKHWVNYDIDIAPDATNQVGTDHVFTVTVTREDGILPDPEAVSGAHPTVVIVSGPGSLSASTCDDLAGTNADGECTITLTSDETGTTVVRATYLATEENTSNTFSDLATKNWVDYGLEVEPDGVNHAGVPHTFNVWLFEIVNDVEVGLDGETVSLAWSGPTGSSLASASCETVAGVCSVVASSAGTGTGTVTASWSTELDSGTVALDDTAVKTWVDWDIAITPDNKTNLVGTDHQFTVKVRYDAGGGLGLQPLAGVKPAIEVVGVGTVKDTNNPNDCNDQGTSAIGTCTVTITSTVTGDSTVTATYNSVHATASNAFENLTATAVKHWVDYKVLVESDAVNTVGDDHVFTVTVTRDTGGEGGFDPLANADVQLAWSGGAGSGITAVSPEGDTELTSCRTDEAGQCTVTVSSSSTLSGDLTATYIKVLDSGTHSFSSDATKRWVNWALSITPAQAENLVGTDHTFVVTVTHDAGEGGGLLPLAGAKPVINLAGLGTVTVNTCADGTNAAGICTVTITSAQPGTSTVSAAFEAVVDQASISLAAQGSKLWVDYRLVVSPKTAVNPVNTTHTFTVTLEKNIGSGWVPAGSEAVNLGLSGPGSITIVDAGLIGSGLLATCTTDAAGTCRVTITSPVAGLATLEASYGAVVGATSRTFTDDGDKLWEAVEVLGVAAVEPPEVLAAPVLSAPVLPAPVLPAELPRTGSPIQAMFYAALMLVGVGSVLLAAGRRRQRLYYPPSI